VNHVALLFQIALTVKVVISALPVKTLSLLTAATVRLAQISKVVLNVTKKVAYPAKEVIT